MKLKELNTPFEKKRMLAYGRDGNTAVRRYIEVQRITGNLYKSRTEKPPCSAGGTLCRSFS